MATLDFTKGDTFEGDLPILDEDGAPFNLTGATVWFTVKLESDTAANDDAALIKNYWISGGASSGITVSTPSNGIITVKVLPAVTDTLIVGGGYRWDVQVKDGNSDVWTAGSGSVVVSGDVTRRITTP